MSVECEATASVPAQWPSVGAGHLHGHWRPGTGRALLRSTRRKASPRQATSAGSGKAWTPGRESTEALRKASLARSLSVSGPPGRPDAGRLSRGKAGILILPFKWLWDRGPFPRVRAGPHGFPSHLCEKQNSHGRRKAPRAPNREAQRLLASTQIPSEILEALERENPGGSAYALTQHAPDARPGLLIRIDNDEQT